jgi:hypothetical protein
MVRHKADAAVATRYDKLAVNYLAFVQLCVNQAMVAR